MLYEPLQKQKLSKMSSYPAYNKISVDDGTKVFYREAGSTKKPTILLLHGYPTSSHMFKDLIPALAPHFHVVAPDLPGFGFTEPPTLYNYTFTAIADTIDAFVTKLNLKKFFIYIFDYGAPTGFRLALKNPERVSGFVVQNGNAYEEGLDNAFWAPIKEYWKTSKEDPAFVKPLLGFVEDPKTTIDQYTDGEPDASQLDPLFWTLDLALLKRKGQTKIQVELFHSYQLNVELYPKFQKYLRSSNVPVLLLWGKNDKIFPAEGAEPYKRDVKNLTFHLLEAGHFAIASHLKEISSRIIEVFGGLN